MEEIFKDIPGYEGLYQVSNLGRVKSLPRKVCNHLGCYMSKEKIMMFAFSKGYFKISLLKDKKRKTYLVHQLVALTFLNHTISGHKIVVDHINDNPLDNKLENLQLITQRENSYKTQGKWSSKYKGVGWSLEKNKWRSYIRIDGKSKHLGYFKCELAAAVAYQNKLKTL
jgi:hypothetical protein